MLPERFLEYCAATASADARLPPSLSLSLEYRWGARQLTASWRLFLRARRTPDLVARVLS